MAKNLAKNSLQGIYHINLTIFFLATIDRTKQKQVTTESKQTSPQSHFV